MPGSYCCVPGCKSKYSGSAGPSFHCFPTRTENNCHKLDEKWLESLKLDATKVTLAKSSKICGLHFDKSCFYYKSGVVNTANSMKRRLKPDSIPTILASEVEKDRESSPSSSQYGDQEKETTGQQTHCQMQSSSEETEYILGPDIMPFPSGSPVSRSKISGTNSVGAWPLLAGPSQRQCETFKFGQVRSKLLSEESSSLPSHQSKKHVDYGKSSSYVPCIDRSGSLLIPEEDEDSPEKGFWSRSRFVCDNDQLLKLFKFCQQCGNPILGDYIRISWNENCTQVNYTCVYNHTGKWSSNSDVNSD